MFLIFNWPGLIILLVSIFMLLIVFGRKAGLTDPNQALIFGLSFLFLDLITRMIIKKYFPNLNIKGGTLFFIPAYIIGIAVLIWSIYLIVTT